MIRCASQATNAWQQPQNLPGTLDILHAEALACFLQNVFMSPVHSLGMFALIFVASARSVFIAGQIKFDLDNCNPISSIRFKIHKGDLNQFVQLIFSLVGKYGRTNNVVQRGPFGIILLDFLANNVSNGRIESSVVTIGGHSLLLFAAKGVMVVAAISQLSSVNLALTIDGVVLNSVYELFMRYNRFVER